jgi:polyisoprenyl-phosphate glycosyltransferase
VLIIGVAVESTIMEGGLLILIPIYNDWAAVSLLLPALDRALEAAGLVGDVLLVDDGSTVRPPDDWRAETRRSLGRIQVLSLRRNVGHQRAIAIALAFVEQHLRPAMLVVMDGDGEDAPEDVPRLLECLEQNRRSVVVFAERTRRSESMMFRAFYALYRCAHLLLTGIPVRVGNFSVIPSAQLRQLVVVSELWNHYAAAVFKARVPRTSVPTVRAPRLEGRSRMNFVGLVTHGLSALSVHSELIGVRLLVVTAVLAGMMLSGLLVVVSIRLFTPLAIPGWASTTGGLLLVLLFQAAAFAAFFAFLILHGRSQPAFIPLRDYDYFVDHSSTSVAVDSHSTSPTGQNANLG